MRWSWVVAVVGWTGVSFAGLTYPVGQSKEKIAESATYLITAESDNLDEELNPVGDQAVTEDNKDELASESRRLYRLLNGKEPRGRWPKASLCDRSFAGIEVQEGRGKFSHPGPNPLLIPLIVRPMVGSGWEVLVVEQSGKITFPVQELACADIQSLDKEMGTINEGDVCRSLTAFENVVAILRSGRRFPLPKILASLSRLAPFGYFGPLVDERNTPHAWQHAITVVYVGASHRFEGDLSDDMQLANTGLQSIEVFQRDNGRLKWLALDQDLVAQLGPREQVVLVETFKDGQPAAELFSHRKLPLFQI